MRKYRILPILLCLCLMLGLSSAALAVDLTVPGTTNELRVPLDLITGNGAFAGLQFTVELSGGITFTKYDRSATTFNSASPVQTSKNGKLYLGVFSDSNNISPKSNGELHLGDLVFGYTGSAPVSVTISEFKLVRLVNKDTTSSETFKAPDGSEFKVTYNISRETDNEDDNEKPGGNDGGNGGNGGGVINNPGGSSTTPPIQIGDEETPLAVMYAPFINGYPDGTVKPNGSLSRAELAQIIYNLYHSGAESPAADYTDITADHWAIKAISFCQEKGFMIGSEGRFMPDKTLTRAELCTAFARIKNLTLTDAHPFPDVGNHWAKQYIGAMYAAEYITGYPDGTFRAENAITRAEAVTLICRAEGRDVELFNTDKTFTDLDSSFWAYKSIMNAANGYISAAA